MRVGIAILNWNGVNLLKSHLKGVVDKSEDCSIYIIDNNSNDDSLNFVKHNFPQVKLITLDKNYGFAEGYNIELKSEIIIVTNGLNHFYFKLDKNKNQYIQEKDLTFYNK